MDPSILKRTYSSTNQEIEPYLNNTSSKLSHVQAQCSTHLQFLLSQPHVLETAYICLIAMFLFTAVTTYLRRRSSNQDILSTPLLEKAPSNVLTRSSTGTSTPRTKDTRRPGTWTPSSFKTPVPPSYPNWDINTTKPLPYRPFRYGPKYFVTMGLRNIKFDDWIELDNHYPRFHADKTRRIAERRSKCCKTAPEAWDAAVELLEELREYLPARYPTLFSRTPTGVKILWSGEDLTWRDAHGTPLPGHTMPQDPMTTAARMIQDDLAIMLEGADGQYYLKAGAILLPGFWRLEDKFGMPLSEIHTSGDVPQFKEKLERGMMNFFRRLRPEEIVARNNYFLQVDDDLAWSHSIGSEDSAVISWNTAEKNKAIEHHYFRSERQTLRRLPKSGGVVFTIRTYFEPITAVAQEPVSLSHGMMC